MIIGTPASGKSRLEIKEIEQILSSSDDMIYVIDTNGDIVSHYESNEQAYIIDPVRQDYGFNLFKYYDDDGSCVYDESMLFYDIIKISNNGIMPLVEQQNAVRNILHSKYLSNIGSGTQLKFSNICNLIKDYSKDCIDIIDNVAEYYDIFNDFETGKISDLRSLNGKRLFIYDLSNIIDSFKQISAEICLFDIYQYLNITKHDGIRYSWVYINDIDLYFNNNAYDLLELVWKSARMLKGILTGITMTASKLCGDHKFSAVLANTSWLFILNQTKSEALWLSTVYCDHDARKDFVNDVCGNDAGTGIIISPGDCMSNISNRISFID